MVIVNGRMTSKALAGYLFLRPLLRRWAPHAVGAMAQAGGMRFGLVFGAAKTSVTGNIELGNGWQLSWLTYDSATKPTYIRGYLRPVGVVEEGGHAGDVNAKVQFWHAQYVSGRRLGPKIYLIGEPAVSSVAETLSTSSLNSISAASGTFVIEHDATDAGSTILSLGSGAITVPAASAQTGYQTQRLAVAYNAGGTRIVNNGGAETTAAALAFGSGLSVGQGLHIKRIRWYSQELTEEQMWELTRPPITGPSESAAIMRGRFPLVMANCAKVSTTGIKPCLLIPIAAEIIFDSLMPTSIKFLGNSL